MKIIAIMQARMGSTRLPGKILKIINGKPLLEYCIERSQKSKLIDQLILATSTNIENDVIEHFCKERNVECFRGSEDDVLGRYYFCAKKYKADIIVRLTGDCPLIDYEIIDKTIEFYLKNNFNYVRNAWFIDSYPSGFDVEVFSFDILKKYHLLEDDITKREHVLGNISQKILNKGYFSDLKKEYINSLNFNINLVHLSIDTQEDFIIVNKIIEQLKDNHQFSFIDVMEYINENPEIIKINVTKEQEIKILNIKNNMVK